MSVASIRSGLRKLKADQLRLRLLQEKREKRIEDAHRAGLVVWVGSDTVGRPLLWTLPPGQRPPDPGARELKA